MTDDDGTGTTGTVINNAWKQEFYNQIDDLTTAMLPLWTPVPFTAAYFTAATGTWTVPAGSVTSYHYAVMGKILFLNVVIGAATTLSATTASVKIFLPPGYTLAQTIQGPFSLIYQGTWVPGFVFAPAGQSQITFYPNTGATGTFAAGNLLLSTFLTLPRV